MTAQPATFGCRNRVPPLLNRPSPGPVNVFMTLAHHLYGPHLCVQRLICTTLGIRPSHSTMVSLTTCKMTLFPNLAHNSEVLGLRLSHTIWGCSIKPGNKSYFILPWQGRSQIQSPCNCVCLNLKRTCPPASLQIQCIPQLWTWD